MVNFLLGILFVLLCAALFLIWFIGWNMGMEHWHWPSHAKSSSGEPIGACLKCGRWDHY